MALGSTSLYKENDEGRPELVGVVASCSLFDPSGPSYVHIYKCARERLGIPDEPHDWFFGTFKEAVAWAYETIGY